MTEDYRKLSTARITSSPARLAAEIRRADPHPRVVLEACNSWYWAADELTAAGAEVHLADPLGVKAFRHRRVKNDEPAPATWPTCRGWAGCLGAGSPAGDPRAAVRALPGIGPVPGAVIAAEIGDITRFRHPARLCSQAGLAPAAL
ncbi:MAG TPA: transposase [Trebonia sp.]